MPHSTLRLPLAPCPAPPPGATHNKADLSKMMSLPIRERGKGEGEVGLAVLGRKSITVFKQQNDQKTSAPAPWALPHTSPRSYPRPSFL